MLSIQHCLQFKGPLLDVIYKAPNSFRFVGKLEMGGIGLKKFSSTLIGSVAEL